MSCLALAKGGLAAFQVKETLRAGKQAEKTYQDYADEERRQATFEGALTTEKLHQELKTSQAEEGQIKSTAAGKGLRVGGSVGTMLDQAKARFRDRRRMLNLQTSESMRRREIRAKQFTKAGKQARRAAGLEALGTGISAGFKLGKKFPKEDPLFG